MDLLTNNVLMMICGGMLFGLGEWIFDIRQRHKDELTHQNAKATVERYGMNAQLYLPSLGEEHSDPDLRYALELLAHKGYITTDKKGQVVGKLLPTAKKGTHLRLVVSND